MSLFICGCQGALLLFASKFLELEDSAHRLYRFRLYLGFALLFVGMTFSTVDYRYVSSFGAFVALLVPLILAFVGILQVLKGNKLARLFVIAQAVYLLGVALLGAKNLGLLSPSFYTNYGVQIGSALEMILLSLGLGFLMRRQNNINSDLKLSLLKADAVEQTAKMIAHDIKKPFSMIRTMIEALSEVQNEKQLLMLKKKFTDEMGRVLSAVEHLIQDFMHLGRQPEISTKPVDIVKLFSESICELRYVGVASKIPVEYKAIEHRWVYADSLRIKRILNNVVSNALEANDGFSEFTFSSEIEINEYDQGFVKITIANSGRPPSDELISKMFDPFVTSDKDGGNGLGLAIAANIIKTHKGRIWAEKLSETMFAIVFTLPGVDSVTIEKVSQRRSIGTKTSENESPVLSSCLDLSVGSKEALTPPLSKNKLVVIDDCPFIREAWSSMHSDGFKVLCFEKPEDLLQSFAKSYYRIDQFAVIVLDFHFGGLSQYDGGEFARLLRTECDYTGPICLSSDAIVSSTCIEHINHYIDKSPKNFKLNMNRYMHT